MWTFLLLLLFLFGGNILAYIIDAIKDRSSLSYKYEYSQWEEDIKDESVDIDSLDSEEKQRLRRLRESYYYEEERESIYDLYIDLYKNDIKGKKEE